jgi:UDP-glucose 4-epimerase
MSILVLDGAASIRSHSCFKILNPGKSIIVVDNFWNSKPEFIPRIRQITGNTLPFYEINLLNRDFLAKFFTENEISAVIHFIILKTVRESVRIPITYYHSNLNHFIFLELIVKSNVIKIIFSSLAIVCRLNAKLRGREINPSSNTKLIIPEIQTNVWKSDNPWNVLLQRYLNTLGGCESDLMGEDRNDFVRFFWGNWSWKSSSMECFRKRL